MSDPFRVRDCTCLDTPHPDGDVVFFPPQLDLNAGLAVTSAIANSCAWSSVPEPTANVSNATSSAIGLGLCMGRPLIIAPVAPEIARIDPLRRLVFASIRVARGRRLVARVACGGRGLPILSRLCRLPLLPWNWHSTRIERAA